MFYGRRLVAAAFSLISGACLHVAPAAAASEGCASPAEVTVLPSPLAPWSGAPLRVMVVADKPVEGVLSLIAPDGSVVTKADRHEGPPYSWFVEVAAPAAGTWHAKLVRDGAPADCSPISRDIAVAARKPEAFRIPAGSIWQLRNNWNSSHGAVHHM